LRIVSAIKVHSLLKDTTTEIWIFEPTNRQQVNLASKSILKMMTEPKESLRQVQIRLLKFHEQIHIATGSAHTTCE
jgi:hypothetical protein